MFTFLTGQRKVDIPAAVEPVENIKTFLIDSEELISKLGLQKPVFNPVSRSCIDPGHSSVKKITELFVNITFQVIECPLTFSLEQKMLPGPVSFEFSCQANKSMLIDPESQTGNSSFISGIMKGSAKGNTVHLESVVVGDVESFCLKALSGPLQIVGVLKVLL